MGTYLFGQKINEDALVYALGYLTPEQWASMVTDGEFTHQDVRPFAERVDEEYGSDMVQVIMDA